jgi:hypothetical protein
MKRLAVATAILLVCAISFAHAEPATPTVPPPSPPIWSQAIMTGAFSLFAGAAAGAAVNFLAGIVTQSRAARQRATALRASLSAELTQLIKVMKGEIIFADAAP